MGRGKRELHGQPISLKLDAARAVIQSHPKDSSGTMVWPRCNPACQRLRGSEANNAGSLLWLSLTRGKDTGLLPRFEEDPAGSPMTSQAFEGHKDSSRSLYLAKNARSLELHLDYDC